MNRKDFIATIASDVLADAIKKKILPSLTIAQACLESANGESELASVYHNYFGIKGSGSGGQVSYQTTEYEHGVPKKVTATFAAYKCIEDGIAAHTDLFHNGVSWNKTIYHPLFAVSDYKEAAKVVQECGYATDPKYANKLIGIMEAEQLYKYDQQYWDALARHVETVPDWKTAAIAWLQNSDNVSPPISSDHGIDDALTYAELGTILSRLVRK